LTRTGQIIRWDAERGFGFIATAQGQRNIFFHARDVAAGVQPAEGMAVRFKQIEVGGKGPRAMAVQPLHDTAQAVPQRGHTVPRQAPAANAPRRPGNPARRSAPERSPPQVGAPYLVALLLWLALLAWGTWRDALPLMALVGLLALNIVTFFSYAFDKGAAERGQWRTRESTLHLLALMGGWPAARLAQQALRHKSSKREFLAVYAVTVALNLGALGWWISQGH